MAFHTPDGNPRVAGRRSDESTNHRLQISPPMATHNSLRTMASDSTLRSSRLNRLLRRGRPVPPPIAVPQFECDESPPPTAVPTPPVPHLPSPLLAGCPGREISGAKSDGREWAYDFDSPPVLVYPDDLSKTTFHEHPLAHELKWEKGWETQQLALYGLILPEKIDNGTPTYTWESDEEEEEDTTKAVILSKPPKTPPAMATKPNTGIERPRTPSNIMHKVKTFANFVANSDMEKEVPELPTLKELLDQFGMPPGTPTEATPRSFLRPTKSSGSLRPKTPTRSVPSATKLRNKRSGGIEKSQISDPVAPEEMRRVGNDFSQAASRKRTASESRRLSSQAASLRSPSNLISSSASSNMPLFLLQPQHPTVYFGTNEPPPKFRLARPRISPMEHARQYLIAKSRAEREGGECTVPKPDLTWCWSENYKEFLLLPSIPDGVTRNLLPDEEEADPIWKKKKRPIASFMDTDDQATKRRSFIPLPLNLAPSSPLLPAHFRNSSQSSVPRSPSKRDSSLDSFSLDQPRLSSTNHSMLPPAKANVADPCAAASPTSSDFFVNVRRGSGREFSSSFPPHLLAASSTDSSSTRQQGPLPASERDASVSPPLNTFTSSLADSCVDREDVRFEPASDNAPMDITPTHPNPVVPTQRTLVAAAIPPKSAWNMSATHLEQVSFNNTQGELPDVQRPDSALSCCTVIRSKSPSPSTDRDENGVSPNSVDYQYSDLPPTPISPLISNSPQSPATDDFAPLQDTRTRDTLDDAQTQQPCAETVLRSIVDDVGDGADFPDTSSVYSQDSIITAVHLPLTDCRRAPLDFMSQRQNAVETEEETLTPRHLSELSSAEAQLQARTVQPSPVLRPVSYIPDTETAQNYSSSEASLEYQSSRCSQASASTLTIDSQPSRRLGAAHDALSPRTYESRMDADIRRFRALERQNMSERGENAFVVGAGRRHFDEMQARSKPRSAQSAAHVETHTHETASIESVASSSTSQNDRYSTASDAPSITSASTTESRRSQALSVTSAASSNRSTGSKRARRPRVEATPNDTVPIASHNTARDVTRFPLDPVMESPAPPAGLRPSVTSPVVATADRSRKSLLPNSRDPARPHRNPKTSEELPSLKVRRRRAVADLAHIPVSQAYPQPLRLSAMKNPSPAVGNQVGDSTVMRSPSRLITDISDELNQEMEEVLSPHSAALAFRPESPDESDIETPTRRPLRQARSMKSIGYETPRLPAPNKPLPSLPGQTARVKTQRGVAANAFIDVDFGPGPAVSQAPASAGLPPQPAPPPTAPLPRPPIPVAVPIVPLEPSSPSVSAFGSTYVTHADFSVKKDRTVRPAASMATFSYRPSKYPSLVYTHDHADHS